MNRNKWVERIPQKNLKKWYDLYEDARRLQWKVNSIKAKSNNRFRNNWVRARIAYEATKRNLYKTGVNMVLSAGAPATSINIDKLVKEYERRQAIWRVLFPKY